MLDPAKAALFGSMSTGEYLRLRWYSQAFVRHYFLPMCAAVWSVPESQVHRPYGFLTDGFLIADCGYCSANTCTLNRQPLMSFVCHAAALLPAI